jgi:hypothetical protein
LDAPSTSAAHSSTKVIPHPCAWMYSAANRDRRALMPSVNGRDEFTFHTQLRPDEKPEQITDVQAKLMFQAALGTNLDVEIVGTAHEATLFETAAKAWPLSDIGTASRNVRCWG